MTPWQKVKDELGERPKVYVVLEEGDRYLASFDTEGAAVAACGQFIETRRYLEVWEDEMNATVPTTRLIKTVIRG